MDNIANQTLLFHILDLFAQKFERNAVLRGGMVLRLLGCERHTNDLDYLFVPFKSKNEVVKDVLSVLSELEGVQLDHSLNSKCLRIKVQRDDAVAMVEVKVGTEISTEVLSTRPIAEQYNYPPRMVRVVSYPVALANKMAAWNERRIIRDIYDIWFFLRMGVKPDVDTLALRLKKSNYSRLVPKEDFFTGGGVKEFYNFLRERVNLISQEEIKNSLSDMLGPDELVGLDMLFRAEMAKLTF